MVKLFMVKLSKLGYRTYNQHWWLIMVNIWFYMMRLYAGKYEMFIIVVFFNGYDVHLGDTTYNL